MTGMRFSSTQVRTVSRTARSSSDRSESKLRKSTPVNWEVAAAVAISSSGMGGWLAGGKVARRPRDTRWQTGLCFDRLARPLRRALRGTETLVASTTPCPTVIHCRARLTPAAPPSPRSAATALTL